MLQSESKVFKTVLTARGRHRAYRHHLWMRRALELHRLIKLVSDAIGEDGSVDSKDLDVPVGFPSADRILYVAAAAGRESLNEVSCDRMDTIGPALCVAAVAARFHALFSLPALAASTPGGGKEGELRLSDPTAYAWALPPVLAAALGLDGGLVQGMAELAVAKNPRGFEGGWNATFDRRPARAAAASGASGAGDDDGPAGRPKTLGLLVDRILAGAA